MWLLEQIALDTIKPFLLNGSVPTAEQNLQLEDRFSRGSDDSSRIMTASGTTAIIEVSGIITKNPNFFAMFFGGGNTTWGEIVEAIQAAEGDPNVKDIRVEIDSPGGAIDGMFEGIAALRDAKKPTKTVFRNQGASAAFALGVQSDEVVAANEATRIGSVGVVTSIRADESVVTITSSEAPDKAPDVSTEEGKNVVRAQLDDIHDLFAGAIASARSTTVDTVNAKFGRGGVFLATQATERGMIDGLESTSKSKSKTKTPATAATDKTEVRTMDLAQLKAEHPQLHASIVEEATKAERERVQAHMIAGRINGAMDIAEKAIEEGTPYGNDLVRAKYDEAGKKKDDLSARNDDDDEAAAALKKANTDKGVQTADDKLHDEIAAAVADDLGFDGEAK